MERDGSGASALVGLDEFVVTAQLFDDDGEWFLGSTRPSMVGGL
jgi:hypothetical protein